MTDLQLQLEALDYIQQWSIWLISLSTGMIGLMAFIFKEKSPPKQLLTIKLFLLFSVVSIVAAIFLVGAIPAAVQNIPSTLARERIFFNLIEVPGIYGIYYFQIFPLWILINVHRMSFLISILFAVRVVWSRIHNVTS